MAATGKANASELQKAIEKLLKKEKDWEAFMPKPAVGAKPGGVGTGRPSSSQAGGGLEESDATQREYYPGRTWRSVDGVITFFEEPIKSIALVGGGRFVWDEPPAPAP